MADNTEITAGAGTSIATDDVAGVHYQRVKLVDGTADSTSLIPGSSTRGLAVDLRGSTVLKSVTPTISTGIYAAKDAIGGIMEFTSASRYPTVGGIIESVVIVDKDQERSGVDLVLFSATVAGTVTDNAAFDPTDADLANCVGVIPIASGDYFDFNDNAVASRSGVGLAYVCASTSLFGVLVARATPTYTATSDIIVTLGLIQD